MAFIGTPLDTRNTFQSLQGKRFNGDGSTTAFTLDVAPGSVLDIEVFVGNVRQDPNSAYTLSGTTLTFTGAPPSGTNNIYVVHQAKSVGTIGIPDDTISARTLVTLDNSADHVLIEDATDGELKKALIPSASTVADTFTINGSTPTLTIGDAGAEDTKIVFDGNAQDFHIGLDDSADDLLIGKGSTLGTTTHMAFDENGHVTMPLQSAVIAHQNADVANVFGNNSNYSVAFNTEISDKNADFDITNDSTPTNADNNCSFFTAPVTGLYFVTGSFRVAGLTANHTIFNAEIVTSNRKYINNMGDAGNYKDHDSRISGQVTALVDMDANDVLFFDLYGFNTDDTIDIDAEDPNLNIYCGIHLLS